MIGIAGCGSTRRSVLRGVSLPFVFGREGIERGCRAGPHPDGKHLLISYGVGDGEAWLATVDADDVRQVLEDAEHLSWGKGCEALAALNEAL